MDTNQKTESLVQLVDDIDAGNVVLPEFQRDFVWEINKTFDLFDSFFRDIFVGSLIYGAPSFEITVREIDTRPRKGKGSRRKLELTSYNRKEVENRVRIHGFRLLLDGQQRSTSIYRAAKGIDEIWFIVRNDEELEEETLAKPAKDRSAEELLLEISGSESEDHLSIKLSDVFAILKGEHPRERDKAALLAKTRFVSELEGELEDAPIFEQFLTIERQLEVVFRQEKLLSYYLLDTDAEKFALFFERSNSKGIQLDFIDILAAKLYAGFNLRRAVEDFEDENPDFAPLNRDAIVRFISLVVSKGRDTGRTYILANLTHEHFNDLWAAAIQLYRRVFAYLKENRILIHHTWMPYEAMIIPLMGFLRSLPKQEFSQMTEQQADFLKMWYWNSIFSHRYSRAAQTSIIEDSRVLQAIAGGDSFTVAKSLASRLQSDISDVEDLFSINKKYDAEYKGILNFLHYRSGGLVGWQNTDNLTWDSRLEDHHIFPKDYLIKSNVADVDSRRQADSVVNRTLIPKITNIKVSNKRPSAYFSELMKHNHQLPVALEKHLIPKGILEGDYDDVFQIFLDDRAQLILLELEKNVFEPQRRFREYVEPATE